MNENQIQNEFEKTILFNTQFDNLCRTCLSKNRLMFNLTDKDADKDKTFSDMLYECTSVQILINDQLPKLICEDCVQQINACYEFKLSCLKSEKIILNQLEQLEQFNLEKIKSEQEEIEKEDEVNGADDVDDDFIVNESADVDFKQKLSESTDTYENKWFKKVRGAYKCTVCGKEKPKRGQLKQHVNTDHANLFSHKCSYCNEIFTKKYSLKRHISSYHDQIKQEPTIKEEPESNANVLKARVFECSENEQELPSNSERALAEEQIEKLPKGYRCRICTKTKTNITNMLNHIYFHLNIKHFKCPECDKRFVTTSNVNRHIKEVHCSTDPKKKIRARTEHTCALCNDHFRSLRQLQNHLIVDHKQKIRRGYDPVVCSVCHKTCYNNNSLKKHIAGIHLQKKYKCDLCNMSYHSEKGLMGHRRVHGEKSGFHCKFCLVTCTTQQDLDSHMTDEHKDAKTYACHLCSKEFYVEEYLQKHIKNHTAKPKHLCTTCGRTFLSKSNLTTHSRVHTGEKPYICKICNATFTQHSSLRFHSAIHNDERRFKCDLCESTWKRKTDLTQHMRIHLETPQLKCNFCGKMFIWRKRLTAHLRIHTGEKPYPCDFCDKHFRRSSHLKVHSRIHTGERPYVCSVCGRGFIQNHCLVTHMNSHHKE